MQHNEIVSVEPDHLVAECAQKKAEGCRFVTMSCTPLSEDSFDILYHFDKNLEFSHLRLSVTKDKPVPSISGAYFAAFLVENEIQDLFGLRFQGLALDFDRTLYLDDKAERAPFCKYVVIQEKKTETDQ
jgi:ech hydrogenase subunit D